MQDGGLLEQWEKFMVAIKKMQTPKKQTPKKQTEGRMTQGFRKKIQTTQIKTQSDGRWNEE
ncbi:hypothetical protein PI124_g22494 [Phytophthora idaei]|nr:hypothetical protein PI125_g22351 [Phytophthora idaei]KAG3125955.1 hypothetical protein PI126_g22532 [Phytophthora idaei]KAG3232423.1 hypothetical protein PI124_g22494 [Phytophthora idaei]